MFKNLLLKSILLQGCFYFSSLSVLSQPAEVRLLQKINPQQPTSTFWKATTKSAKPISVGVPVAMFTASLIMKEKDLQEKSLETLGTFVVTTVSTIGLKTIIDRQRPYQKYQNIYPYEFDDGKSFPSGHASVAFGTATSLSIQYKKWYVVVPAYAWASAVGYSRLYLGQHYPTDIVGAAVVGAGSAFFSHKANKWLRKK